MDLTSILGRSPSPKDLEKFLTVRGRYAELASSEQGEAIPGNSGATMISSKIIERAQTDLENILGREPNPKELEKFLAAVKHSTTTNKNSSFWKGRTILPPNKQVDQTKVNSVVS